MSKSVGVIGLGIMGGAIASNLKERGWTVTGYDLDPAKRAAMVPTGVDAVESIAEVVERTETIITSLPTPVALIAVANEIASGAASGRIVIETSTMALADKLKFAEILSKAGHSPLDCSLSGTGAQAKVRDLIVYASGDSAAIAAVTPIFADFAKQSADLGAYGNGSRMKFVANLLVAIHNVAAAEAMVLAMKAGLDLEQVIELVGPGAGGSRMFQMRSPMMAESRYEPAAMRVSTWQKDMAIIAAFAEELGAQTPLFSTTAPVYDEAMAMGLGDQDTAAVCRVLELMSGISRCRRRLVPASG
jgi:3-hydroxyisobutyrate dehydrogenase-like beta-hydroxyacid dehydrogenase